MPKKISDIGMQELRNWLESNKVNIQKLHRDFSDVAPFAKIIKKHYPRLVDLFHYPPCNSSELKRGNWESFNFKVLSRLGLRRSAKELENITKCQPGAIEVLLYDFLMLLKASGRCTAENFLHNAKSNVVLEDGDVMTITVHKKQGNTNTPVAQKMISYAIFEKVQNELNFKDIYLETSQQKIKELENYIKLKDEFIKDLCDQITKLTLEENKHIRKSSTQPVRQK